MVPLLSAETERTASETLVMPRRARLSDESTVTGDGVSVLVRRKIVPVMTISSWFAPAFAFSTGTGEALVPACGALEVAWPCLVGSVDWVVEPWSCA